MQAVCHRRFGLIPGGERLATSKGEGLTILGETNEAGAALAPEITKVYHPWFWISHVRVEERGMHDALGLNTMTYCISSGVRFPIRVDAFTTPP